MTKYTLTTIKAIADCEPETVQEAILVHLNSDENGDGDCIIFGYEASEITTDDELVEILINESCPAVARINDAGIYETA